MISEKMPAWDGYDEKDSPVCQESVRHLCELTENLKIFGVPVEIEGFNTGPVFTLFKVRLAPGVPGRRLTALENDLARTLCVTSVQVIEHIPGTAYAGILIRNTIRRKLMLSTLLNRIAEIPLPSPLSCVLGLSLFGEPVIVDIRRLPHLLIGGMTGSGKSVLLNSLILGLLTRIGPETVRLMLIAPRPITFSGFADLPHMLTDVIEGESETLNALRWVSNETERRFRLMSALGTTGLSAYNELIQRADNMGTPLPDPFQVEGSEQSILSPLPTILVVFDDIADLILSSASQIEEMIFHLVQKAHIAGLHLIISTQRPSVDVISGRIKANIPARIALAVVSKADSRTILEQEGAECLFSEGDMLFMSPETLEPIRLQGAWCSREDIHRVVSFWKAQFPTQYVNGITNDKVRGVSGFGNDELDPLYDEAVNIVIRDRIASVSRLQRELRIGFNRASRIIEQMEDAELVGSPGHNGVRDVRAPVFQSKSFQEQEIVVEKKVRMPTYSETHGIFRRLVSWWRR